MDVLPAVDPRWHSKLDLADCLVTFALQILGRVIFPIHLQGTQSDCMARDLRDVKKCPVCRSYAKNDFIPSSGPGPDVYKVRCSRCGVFEIIGTLSVMLGGALRGTEFTSGDVVSSGETGPNRDFFALYP